MEYILPVATGFLLDMCFGDPVWLYHPVRLMGAWISGFEKAARKFCCVREKSRASEEILLSERKRKETCLVIAGGILVFSTVLLSAGIPFLFLRAAGQIHPVFRFCLESFWCYQILAAKSLKTESMSVYYKLKKGTIEEARKAVSRIVGRDTEHLDKKGVAKAAVETIAENTSDGEIAPLLYLMIGGPCLGFAYKAVNTCDSMIGYKDEKYLYIGRASAKLDDVVNYLPARMSAILMTGAAFLCEIFEKLKGDFSPCKISGKRAWNIFKRDRYNHASPNSAQTESVCAGALGIQLAGNAWYFGKLYKKPTIGDPSREIEAEDIVRADRLMYVTAVLALILFGMIRMIAGRIV